MYAFHSVFPETIEERCAEQILMLQAWMSEKGIRGREEWVNEFSGGERS